MYIATLASCSAWDYVKCAAKVAECAATCSTDGITSSGCISCFGGAYDRCKGCLPFHTALQNTGFSLQGECVDTVAIILLYCSKYFPENLHTIWIIHISFSIRMAMRS